MQLWCLPFSLEQPAPPAILWVLASVGQKSPDERAYSGCTRGRLLESPGCLSSWWATRSTDGLW